jgi:hypothetical protein
MYKGKPGQPAQVLASVRELIVGAGLDVNWVIVNEVEGEVPPPGVGFETVTLGVPGVTKSETGMAAVSLVLLTKVVALLAPFHCTTEAGKNEDPISVRVSGGAPACAVVGASEETAGTG